LRCHADTSNTVHQTAIGVKANMDPLSLLAPYLFTVTQKALGARKE